LNFTVKLVGISINGYCVAKSVKFDQVVHGQNLS